MGVEGGEISMNTAIRLTDVDLHFPKKPGMLQGFSDLMRSKIEGGPGRFTALNGINLEVKVGEVVGIIGRNGSGKSTVLRAISGIYRPDSGKVEVRGQTSLLAGVSVGLNHNLTGRENVHLYGSILGHQKDTMESMMEEIIEFSELGEFIEQPLRTYSSGMKARLGIAVASAVEPEILLIDEVLGVGDQEFREKSKKRILALVENSGTVVIVSHNFGLMKSICDRVVLVHKGRIEQIGEPEEMIQAYKNLS